MRKAFAISIAIKAAMLFSALRACLFLSIYVRYVKNGIVYIKYFWPQKNRLNTIWSLLFTFDLY